MAPTVLTSTVPGSGENAQQGTAATGHPKEAEAMAPRMSGAKQRQMRASGRLAGPRVLEERPRAAGTDQRRRPTARGRGRRRLGLRLSDARAWAEPARGRGAWHGSRLRWPSWRSSAAAVAGRCGGGKGGPREGRATRRHGRGDPWIGTGVQRCSLPLSLSDGARTGGRDRWGEMGIDAGRLGLRAGVGGWA